jgi:membrane fusion protein, multidrug efflux system
MRYVLAILGLVVLLGSLVAVKGAQIKSLIGMGQAMQAAGPPPEVVSTRPAERQTWERTLAATGSVMSAKGVSVSNDAPGVVTAIYFESGKLVKQGEPLLEIDASVERAQLASTRARLELASTTLKRSTQLVTSGVETQAQLDVDTSTSKGLEADVAALEAQIARKTIRAPFAGKLGIRAVNLGQYLAPGTMVTVLEAPKQVFVDFSLPQQELPRLSNGMKVRVTEAGQPAGEGQISAIDPAVDAITRNVKLRASLPNEGDRLRSGMFVQVQVVRPEMEPVVAVPLNAVVHASYGDSVFVTETQPPAEGADKPKLVARQKFVVLGPARGDFVSVTKGLEAGEEVVTAGAFKLRNGAPITVNNDVKTDPQLAPQPKSP